MARPDLVRAGTHSGKPWPPEDVCRTMLESLSCWYTLDEMARIVGRTSWAVRRRMNLLSIHVKWRKNHNGGTARCWLRSEKWALLDWSQALTQSEAGELLGLSRHAVQSQMRAQGVSWGQGTVSLADVARLAGCSPQWVSRKAHELFGRKRRFIAGQGKGSRWRLDIDEAKALMEVIRPGRVDWIDRFYSERELRHSRRPHEERGRQDASSKEEGKSSAPNQLGGLGRAPGPAQSLST